MRMTGRNITLCLVALGLGLAGTLPAGAQPTTPPPQSQQGGGGRHGLAGAITAVSAGTIMISDRSGKTVTVKMTPTTRILKSTEATLADVKTGEPVQIFAEPSQGGSLVARAIELNPMPMGGRPMRGGQSVDGTRRKSPPEPSP